jgi:ribose transport system permease protein
MMSASEIILEARGLTMLWTRGFPISGLGPTFAFIGTGVWLGIPMPVWITGAWMAIFVIVTRRARFGRHLYAVGGKERAALMTGLRVNRIKPNARYH